MKRLKNNSFLRKLIIYFGMILLIPACTIILLYQQTDKLLRNQIQVSSWNTLNQFFRAVDIALEEAETALLSIMNSDECKEYARRSVYSEKRMSYQAVIAQNKLQQYSVNRYKDVLSYFPYCNKVISGVNGSIDAMHYFKIYFDTDIEVMKEQLDTILQCENKYPRLFSITNEEGETNLCVAAMVQNRNDNRQNYVSMVVLSPKYLDSLLKNAEDSLDGELLIYGAEKELLFSMGDIQIELPEELGKDNAYKVKKEDVSYMVWSEESEVLSGFYAYAIPEAYYWEQLWTIRMIFIWGFLGCILLSITLAYRLSNRAYIPVKKMMKVVLDNNHKELNEPIQSEFEYVTSRISEEREENQKLKGLVNDNKKAVLNNLVHQLLGGGLSEDAGKEIFEKNNIEVHSPYFFVAVLVAGETKYDDILRYSLENVFCELFDEQHKAYMIALADGRYALVVNLKQDVEGTELLETLERGRQFFWEKIGLALFIGTGETWEGISHIADSYKEAVETMRYRYLYGDNYVLSYKQVKERQLSYQTTTESKLFMRFMSYITGCEELQDADEFVANVLYEYKININASIENVEVFKNRIVAVLNNILISGRYPVQLGNEKLALLMRAGTLDVFSKNLSELLEIIRKMENDKKENTTGMWIREYIQNHYSDINLNVQSIANCLNISYVEASRYFKESYNMKITDYIAQVRIQNAKKMLESTDSTLSEIAEKCGFLDSGAFLKIFKKLENITPGNYRKIAKKSNQIFEKESHEL